MTRGSVPASSAETQNCDVAIIGAGPVGLFEVFEEKSVFYLVRRRDDFRGRRVVIAGGGDSAVDWALALAEIAERVTVVHRRGKFRAAPQSAAKLQQLAEEGRIDLAVPYQLHALEGDAG